MRQKFKNKCGILSQMTILPQVEDKEVDLG